MTFHDRLALAVCRSFYHSSLCPEVCYDCRRSSSAVAHELANWLSERFGHSETAELIRGSVPEVQP